MGRHKQAVVVIHGVGVHHPMDTLRGFVKAVLPEAISNNPKKRLRSKPDRMSESFELRRLQVPGNYQNRRPTTDFYEYYWHHHICDSKYSSVLSWLYDLVKRPFKQVPEQLKLIYLFTYSMLGMATLLLLWGFFDQTGQTGIDKFTYLYKQKQTYFCLLLLILQLFGSRIILGYIADAARYLTPSPGNVKARNAIRAEGIKLLREIHKSGKYFRVIVVGHSLGSVIGYDILRHLWVDLRESHDPKSIKRPVTKRFDSKALDIHALKPPDTEEGRKKFKNAVEKFQQEQHKLWREHREAGIPWLVTDFITLGSPLVHASLLMADTPATFKDRKTDLEFPCCPPEPIQGTHYSKLYNYSALPHPTSVIIPHHGAVFASTRWTNLYFPYRKPFFGDIIGGSLASSFGNAIKDVAVRPTKGGFIPKTLSSHTRYWELAGQTPATYPVQSKETDSLEALRSAMRLESLHSRGRWPDPTKLRSFST